MRRIVFLWLLGAVCGGLTAFAREPEWGDLRGRFVMDGVIPPSRAMVVSNNYVACGPRLKPDESLIVDEGIANVFVWLIKEDGISLPIHREVRMQDQVELGIEECRFQPHALLAHTSQTVAVRNFTPIGHAAYYDSLRNNLTSRAIPATGSDDWKFPKAENAPIPIACSIHPWMSAYILVQDHPYAAITDRDGCFSIRSIPVGEHRFRFWHERTRFIQEVSISGKRETLQRGIRTINVSRAEVDLGPIHVAADQFSR